MKHSIRYFFCILLSCLILSTLSSATKTNNKTDSETFAVGFKYTIREYNGKVAVFDYGQQKPKIILDSLTNSLPEEDAENIRRGINVRTDSELQYLIEAFD